MLHYLKLAFICPYPYYARGINEATLYPPIGLASIAAYLEKQGTECNIIDANVTEEKPEQILKRLRMFNPDIIGIQMNIVTAQAGVELAKLVKEHLSAKVVLGGPFATSKYEQLLRDTNAFAIVRGEGEQTFLEIAEGKRLEDIEGIAFLNDKSASFIFSYQC